MFEDRVIDSWMGGRNRNILYRVYVANMRPSEWAQPRWTVCFLAGPHLLTYESFDELHEAELAAKRLAGFLKRRTK